MKRIGFLSLLFFVLVLGFAPSSWAWRGGGYYGGWHGGGGGGWRGWGGPRVGVYLGGPYYDPYYDPYYYPGPYAYPAYPAYPADPNAGLVPDNVPAVANSNGNDQPSTAQISRQRAQLDYDYADGDITKAQYDAGIAQLQRAAQQPAQKGAPAVASAEPTERATPSSSVQGLARVSDLHLELTTLLDQKLKDGDITRAQHDSEVNYLNQIKSQAHDDANANNGRLTSEQENAYIQQLHQAYYSINHNLITH